MELNNQISDDIMLKNISKMLPGSGSSLSFLGIRYWFYCFFIQYYSDVYQWKTESEDPITAVVQ